MYAESLASPEQQPAATIDQGLLARLIQCADLPSPVGIVMRILELGQDPNASIADVAKVITLDPALSARLLRMANSPLYARQRKTENLRQAIKLFGLEGTLTLALSFSVVTKLREQDADGFDYALYWRRSVAAATCAQVIGDRLSLKNREDLFLAALLQDIGMLALARARPGIYQVLAEGQSRQERVCEHEQEQIGMDHAILGSWLLKQWNFPADLQSAVRYSHDPAGAADDGGALRDASVVALSSDMAELWCEPRAQALLRKAMKRADTLLGFDGEAFAQVLESAGSAIGEVAHLFDVEIRDEGAIDAIVGQARELTVLRHIRMMQRSSMLEDRTRQLEEENRRDVLTGLFNRSCLQEALAREIESSNDHGWPYAVIFVDLDRFKLINDQHGHLAGDCVLRNVAHILESSVRAGDIVSRYGGEEFVIILPGAGPDSARMLCERLLKAFRSHTHRLDEETELVVTASIGVAVHGDELRFKSMEEVLRAADDALYAAKHQGRDRCVFYQE
jgi:diguanylate cyclase (GGDEF)-like protein